MVLKKMEITRGAKNFEIKKAKIVVRIIIK
jgi:hypothetical protein